MPQLLETRDLKKHYRMGASTVRALDGVSLSVQQGEFVALLGTSGSGKSTLLNLIAGLDRPTEGSLRIFDQDLARMSSAELSLHRRRNVGIIFQSFNLVSTMTALENVTLAMMFAGVPRGERETTAAQLLQSIGLGERLSASLPRVQTPFKIVGIVERETGPFGGVAAVSGLMIPLGRAKEIAAATRAIAQVMAPGRAPGRTYNTLVVKVKQAQFTQDVQDQIKKKGFSAFSLNDALQGAKRAFIILDIVLSLIGSIALAVSSLGIMNTMVMSILERTREIGIMKAIGGSDGDIRRIFLIEASAIGFFGGVAGVALGWLVGRAINFGANLYIQNQGGTPGDVFSMPLWLIGGAIGFSIAISLIAGSYPAARAARLDPIQALRHD